MRKVQDALGFRSSRFNQNGAGPVAKKNTGSAVFVIENGCHHVAADNERSFMGSIGNKLSAHRVRRQIPNKQQRDRSPKHFLRPGDLESSRRSPETTCPE